ncbi:MAG: hypothetical protein LBI39_04410 [Puniceicoccales bacterium]|jgi:lipid-A-disaccharide synthase|nr:hypothetical protein [Puniceicoccales bacterium]
MGKLTPPLVRPEKGAVDLLVLAAECSGDELGSELIESYLLANPSAELWAAGGERMAAAAKHFLVNVVDHSAMGIFDVIAKLPFFLRYIAAIVDWIAATLPRRVCFVDSPSLHLRIAKRLFDMGISQKGGGTVSLYCYVAPQVWAWKPERKFAMGKLIDSLAVLFPFEKAHFADCGMDVSCVGHPFVRNSSGSPLRYGENGGLLLLPGSRTAAVRRNLPIMVEAAFAQELEAIRPISCLYPTENVRQVISACLGDCDAAVAENVRLVGAAKAPSDPIVARLAIVGAGTMSLRCALEAIPGVIAYRTNWLTYWLGRRYVRVAHIGIASIILGYEFYAEFIQGDADPRAIAEKLVTYADAASDFAVVADELRSKMMEADKLPAEWLMQ